MDSGTTSTAAENNPGLLTRYGDQSDQVRRQVQVRVPRFDESPVGGRGTRIAAVSSAVGRGLALYARLALLWRILWLWAITAARVRRLKCASGGLAEGQC